MRGDSCSKGREFKSRQCILDGHFSHLFVVKIVMCVWKDQNKLKRGRGWPIFKNKNQFNHNERCLLYLCLYFILFKNGPIPASFCLFSSFSHYNFNYSNWKSLGGVLGIRTQDCRMVGTDKTKEIWPLYFILSLWMCVKIKARIVVVASVTRFGDFLDFGQLFKAFCSN